MSTSPLTPQSSNPRCQILIDMYDSLSRVLTPELEKFIETRPVMQGWIARCLEKIDALGPDDPEADYRRRASSYLQAVTRAAVVHAEDTWAQFQLDKRDPGELDLRVLRHLNLKVVLDNNFYLFSKKPNPLPAAGVRWATAQDWLDALNSDGVILACQALHALPLNSEFKPTPEFVGEDQPKQIALPDLELPGVS